MEFLDQLGSLWLSGIELMAGNAPGRVLLAIGALFILAFIYMAILGFFAALSQAKKDAEPLDFWKAVSTGGYFALGFLVKLERALVQTIKNILTGLWKVAVTILYCVFIWVGRLSGFHDDLLDFAPEYAVEFEKRVHGLLCRVFGKARTEETQLEPGRQHEVGYWVGEFRKKSPQGGSPELQRYLERQDMEFITKNRVRWHDPAGEKHIKSFKTFENKLSELKRKEKEQNL